MPALTDDEFSILLRTTRFTKKEIQDYAAVSDASGLINQVEYHKLIRASGISSQKLIDRIWAAMDADSNGSVRVFELISTISVLLRGTLDDVSRFFFRIYDVDGNGQLSKEEIAAVYAEILAACDLQFGEAERASIQRFILDADANEDGQISAEEFCAAVHAAVQASSVKEPRTLKSFMRQFGFFLIIFFTEMGVSFGLPVLSSLSTTLLADTELGLTLADLALMSSVYYIPAAVGPMFGGFICTQAGPAVALSLANIFVVLGTLLQALAVNAKNKSLILIGRLVLGFGGEITPFTTIELIALFFPKHLMAWAGLRNLWQSGSGFVAFVLLPYLQANYSTSAAMYFPFLLAVCALAASLAAHFYIKAARAALAKNVTPAKVFSAMTSRILPRGPSKLEDFKMPIAFWAVALGVKSFYLAPFGFTSFSNTMFVDRFGLDASRASLLTGGIHLLAGMTGPFFGPLSDKLGNRSLLLCFFLALAAVAFALFATMTTTAIAYIGTGLLALSYGFGDTVAYVAIRLVVGEARAGIGYGLYAVLGNIVAFIVPTVSGLVYASADTDMEGLVSLAWFFCVIMVVGSLLWIVPRIQFGSKSLLEIPADQLIITEDSSINAASLHAILGGGAPVKVLERNGAEMGEIRRRVASDDKA
jgi:nitrate/nitrite transporter NarK/Ca2+-binding EF-hand superfamily protein